MLGTQMRSARFRLHLHRTFRLLAYVANRSMLLRSIPLAYYHYIVRDRRRRQHRLGKTALPERLGCETTPVTRLIAYVTS
jgi:hypothetical protein